MNTQQMLSRLRKGITDYKMIKDGDKISFGGLSFVFVEVFEEPEEE